MNEDLRNEIIGTLEGLKDALSNNVGAMGSINGLLAKLTVREPEAEAVTSAVDVGPEEDASEEPVVEKSRKHRSHKSKE